VIARRIEEFGLRLKAGASCAFVDIDDPAVHAPAAELYFSMRKRHGVTRASALSAMRSSGTLLAAMMLETGSADAMLCGTIGRTSLHLDALRDTIGLREGVRTLAVMQMLMLPEHQLFICDTHYNHDPDAGQVADIALLAAEEVRRFGLTPRVALLSHSSFGLSDAPEAQKMRDARELIRARDPDLAVEGEMRGDAALSQEILDADFPGSGFAGPANVLIMPNLDAANISYNLMRVAAGNGIAVGGIVLGAAKPAHVLQPSSTVRRIVNMTALAVVDASSDRGGR
jgi:malate dehydrogenase (oxaloacetate-decarboxylating)(NADP+)